jgi:hypothetical protein
MPPGISSHPTRRQSPAPVIGVAQADLHRAYRRTRAACVFRGTSWARASAESTLVGTRRKPVFAPRGAPALREALGGTLSGPSVRPDSRDRHRSNDLQQSARDQQILEEMDHRVLVGEIVMEKNRRDEAPDHQTQRGDAHALSDQQQRAQASVMLQRHAADPLGIKQLEESLRVL